MARYMIIVTIIAGFILLAIIVLSFCTWRFRQAYIRDVKANLQRTATPDIGIINGEDISHLPVLVQRYLRYAGVINNTCVHNMRMVFEEG